MSMKSLSVITFALAIVSLVASAQVYREAKKIKPAYRELPSYLELCSQDDGVALVEDIKLEKGDCFSASTANGLKRFTLKGKLFTVSLQNELHAKSRKEPDSVRTGERVNFEGGATGIVSGWMDEKYDERYGAAIIVSMTKE